MRNEAFFTTTAQVLPALLIALIVEMSLYANSRLNQTRLSGFLKEQMRQHSERGERMSVAFIAGVVSVDLGAGFNVIIPCLMILIFVGEASAMLTLFLGTDVGIAPLLGSLGLVAVLGGTALVLWMPIFRIYKQIRDQIQDKSTGSD